MIKKYKEDIIDTFKLSLPIIFGRLGAVLMGVTDNVMIGKVGYNELAAAGIANAVFIMVGIIPIGFLIVGSPMISAAFARNQKRECVDIMKGCIQSSILMSLAFMALMVVLAWNFDWFNQPEQVELLAVDYFYFIIASTLPLMIFIAIEQFSDGLEHTKISMFFNISGLFVNAGINYLLIYGVWIFPELGLVGAGIGTLIARIYMAVGIWMVVKYKKAFEEFDLHLNLLEIHGSTFQKIVKNGIPSGLQLFFEVSAFSFAAVMVGWLGAIPLAAHNIAISIASIAYMLSSGFATGTSIKVGNGFGTKNRDEVLRAGKSGLILVVSMMAFTCVFFLFFNVPLTKIFSGEAEVIRIASELLILAGLFQFADGISVVSMRALLGLEDLKIPTYITLAAYWVISVPLGYLLGFTFEMGVRGVWIALVLGLTAASFLLYTRFMKKAKEL